MLHIDEMFAFISEDDEGEGVCGFNTPNGWMPMVGADWERVDTLREIAKSIAHISKKKIKLVKFSLRTELEEIEPASESDSVKAMGNLLRAFDESRFPS